MAEKKGRSDSLAYVTAQGAGQADAWTTESQGRGGQRLTRVAEVVPPQEVAAALSLHPGEKAVVRQRVILLGDEVIELADSYYPLAVARGTALVENRKIKGGAPTLLAELGYRARFVADDLELREASPVECSALGLDVGTNVLALLRRTTTSEGFLFEAQLMVMKAPRRLHYEIEVD